MDVHSPSACVQNIEALQEQVDDLQSIAKNRSALHTIERPFSPTAKAVPGTNCDCMLQD